MRPFPSFTISVDNIGYRQNSSDIQIDTTVYRGAGSPAIKDRTIVPYDVFQSHFDMVMETVINKIYDFYAQQRHIE